MFVLGYKDVGLLSTYTGGTWVTNMDPTSRLSSKYLGAIAKTTSASSLTLDITIPAGTTFNIIGICNHNLSSTGTITYQVFSDSGRTSNVYDSTALSIGTFSSSLSSKTSADVFADQTDLYLRIIISDASNPDGFFTIGRIFIGKRFSTIFNMMYGAEHSINNDNTIKSKSIGGVKTFSDYRTMRTATFSFELALESEGKEFYELELESGFYGNVFYIFDEDNFNSGLYTYIGTLDKLNALQYPVFNRNTMTFQIEELI